jgi:UDP-N-acetylmuramoylalanine--D-glutamate ligase
VPDAEFVGGDFTAALLDGVDFVAVSPGLAPERELAAIIAGRGGGTRRAGVGRDRAVRPGAGGAEGGARLCAEGHRHHRHQRQDHGHQPDRPAVPPRRPHDPVAGNISPAALDVLRELIDANADELPQAWVLELSSFQLHTTFSLNADAATVLNLTQDHLDWHGSMAAYAADKARIFGADTVRVLNRDDALVMGMAAPGAA